MQLRTVERFNVTSLSFDEPLTLSSARINVAAVATPTRVAFVGGRNELGRALTSVDVFDPRTGALSTASLAEDRGYPAAATIGESVFVGGGTASAARFTYERIDLDSAS